MTRLMTVILGVLLLAVPASAGVYDDFETAGDTNGIDSARWSTITGSFQQEVFMGSNAARSRHGGEDKTGVLESSPIALGSENALSLRHTGFHGGNGQRKAFYTGPLNRNRIEIWGADANGPIGNQPIASLLSQSDPWQAGLVDLADAGVSHAVVRAVDAYCDGDTIACNGGHGWIAIDDVATTTVEDRTLLPNGSFEDLSKANWDFSQANGAWGLGTGIGDNRPPAFEGGRMAASLADGNGREQGTGAISSTGWTVSRQTLKFQLQGFNGLEGAPAESAARNVVEILDGSGTVLQTFDDAPGDNWGDRSADLFALGLSVGDPFSVRVVDGSDHHRKAWIGADHFRMTGVPEPSSMLLLSLAALLLGFCRRQRA